jgi:uncharacterized membrane protein
MYLFAFAVLAACGVLVLSTPLLRAQAPAGTILSFDEPDAGAAFGEGTVPVAINSNGVIVGYYVDAVQKRQHGFLRATDGTFTSFDAPGALATVPTAISSNGMVVGIYSDPSSTSNLPFGFLRYANGQFLTLSAPGTIYTLPFAVNDLGQITGDSADDITLHGFIWTEKTRFTLFNVPFGIGAIGSAINASGQIGGDYADPYISGRYHTFIRDSGGHFRTLDPGVVVLVTGVSALNDSGQAVGSFEDTSRRIHAFVTDSTGVVTVLPSMGRIGDWAVGINNAGVVVGFSRNHFAPTETSFLRDAAGNITIISLPFSNIANQPFGINAGGQVVGWYLNAGVSHGWLMTP